MTLGERIKEQRQKLAYSQEKIAELVGTSRQAVTKWETGRSIPCMENLITLAEIFGISLDELINENIGEKQSEDEYAHTKRNIFISDIIFVLVAVFALWNILKIPALIGYSLTGFFLLLMQIAAVLYIPVYLFWVRPRQKNKIKRNTEKINITERLFWIIGMLAALCICYVLSRHDVLGKWHFMKEWPLDLLIFGFIVIVIAGIFYSRKVMVSTIFGYITGYLSAMLFNTDRMDAGGGGTNNAWIIWAEVYLAIILAGIIWELVDRYIQKKKL